jgi:hypothetical protein
MYFDKPGAENTGAVIRIVLEAAGERGIGHLVVASTTGKSARELLEAVKGRELKIVAVSHNAGFSEEGKSEFDRVIRDELEAAGHSVLTATMATRNVNKAISTKFGGYSQTEIVNATLRMFCQGMKVCPEIAAMAADAGLIPFDDVIAVAGTGRGWDTAAVIRANSSNRFFDIKVREILCKPRSF